jgi:hypothetical protein
MADKIQIAGLREFQSALRDMDAGYPKLLRAVFNRATEIVIDYARPRIPRKTGRAAGSLKARSSQREARIAAGGRAAPWYPWLDFGGGGKRPGRPPRRRYISGGRYIWAGYERRQTDITEIMSSGLAQLARDAGLEVS